MANVAQCLRDGYSTAGSSGTGLGAVSRLAGAFDIYSAPDRGTAVFARVGNNGSHARDRLETGGINVPARHEIVCGDAWMARHTAAGGTVMVADGLGHGLLAAEAAAEASRLFVGSWNNPTDYLQRADGALRKTRGAAVAMAQIDLDRAEGRYVGVGNIAGTIIGGDGVGGTRSLVSHNGTVGVEVRKIQEFVYPWGADALLVMHSDGLTSRWRLEEYPGLVVKHPGLIAGVLYRDHTRGSDDVTVVVARERAA
jgi:serine phosphatase RsbU (regulator of sigma subunit)